jgi:hypothetical protein
MTMGQESLIHYEAALLGFERLRERLADEEALALLDQLRETVEETFWLCRLGLRITPAAIAATPYCRSIRLTPAQAQHIDLLKLGMLEAELSLKPGGLSSPWNALITSRERVRGGNPRKCFEAGFVMHLFLLLQEACRHTLPGTNTQFQVVKLVEGKRSLQS